MIVNSKRRLERCLIWNLRVLSLKLPLHVPPRSAPPPMWLTLLYAKPPSVGVESRGGGSVRSNSYACYSDMVHDRTSQARPLKTQHNSSADKRLQSWLPVCLPTFDIAGRRSLSVPADAVFTNHIGFEDTSHILLNLRICFSSQPLESKPQSFFFTTSEHNSFTVTTEGWTLFCVRMCVLLCLCAEQLEAGVNLPLSTV